MNDTALSTGTVPAAADNFTGLLADLDKLQKSIKPAEGAARIKKAAEDDGEDEGGVGSDADPGNDPNDGDGDDDIMGKALKVTLPDGSEGEAFDAGDLLKSLRDDADMLLGRSDEHAEDLAKALQMSAGLLQVVTDQATQLAEQGALIKSLQADVRRFGNAGRGRASSVTVLEKSIAGIGAAPAGKTPHEIMAKCMSLQESGQLTARDVASAEAHLNDGLPVPARILSLVNG